MSLAGISAQLAQRLRLASPAKLPKILLAGEPMLLQRCAPVDAAFHASDEFENLVRSMKAVMDDGDNAMGIAAPQVGTAVQVIAIQYKDAWRVEGEAASALPLTFLVNPTWRATSKLISHEFEGCLSIPGVTAVVPRSVDIAVEALDLDMKPIKLLLQGWPARVLQHEADHLEGRLYVERMLPRSFRFTSNAHHPLPDDLFARKPRPGRA